MDDDDFYRRLDDPKMNELVTMLAGAPGVLLGIMIGTDKTKPVCKVKFGDGNRDECARFVKGCFCKWTGRMPNQVIVTQDDGAGTVEVKGA